MTITYHPELIQGSDEWMESRRGLITAGSMDLILTPTLKVASNEKERQHLFELLAQRVTGYVEPQYVSDDMLRGLEDEIYAKSLYSEKYAPIEDVGMVTNDRWGFVISCSPDGLVGDDGMVECKSRRQKYQAQTIIDGAMPTEFMLQVQAELMVTERKWCDFLSYCGGMPMFVTRCYPIPSVIEAMENAAIGFEKRLQENMALYLANAAQFHMTERRIHEDIIA